MSSVSNSLQTLARPSVFNKYAQQQQQQQSTERHQQRSDNNNRDTNNNNTNTAAAAAAGPSPSSSSASPPKTVALNTAPTSSAAAAAYTLNTTDAAAQLAKDKRLQLIGARKSGYCGHIPHCIYYERERLPASIHQGHTLPPRGRLQLDGTMVPTQSMVRAEQQRKLAAAGVNAVHPPVATVNEIGIVRRASPPTSPRSVKFDANVTGGSGAKGSSQRGSAAVAGMGASHLATAAAGGGTASTTSSANGTLNASFSVGIGGVHKEFDNADLAKPFSANPSGNGQFGHYSALQLNPNEGGYSNVGSGGDFSATVSPPRSPTARYYRQMRIGEHDGDFGPHPGLANQSVPRYRHVGAGGVCCGKTDPTQYGPFLHHDDVDIHGAPTRLLPHVYGAQDAKKAQFATAGAFNSTTLGAAAASSSTLKGGAFASSSSSPSASAAKNGAANLFGSQVNHNNQNNNALLMNSSNSVLRSPPSGSNSRAPSANGGGGGGGGGMNGSLNSNSGSRLTPFPRYPVLRGPNRMGPRGLETFLTN